MRKTETKILVGDVLNRLSELPEKSVQCVVTSPPYWGLRDYGHDNQIGLEQTPQEYVNQMVAVFREVNRVLSNDGVLWLNLGDSYSSMRDSKASPDSLRGNSDGTAVSAASNRNPKALRAAGLKHKDLVGIPWRVAFALQDDGWYLRQDVIWAKPNPMPESVKDRCTKSHEYIFMLTKNARYFFDNESIKEPAVTPIDTKAAQSFKAIGGKARENYGTNEDNWKPDGKRNKRDVWIIPTKPFKDAHFAVMPEALVEPCILSSSKEGDTVLDPFMGSGTVAVVANKHNRHAVGVELNPEYVEIASRRIQNAGMFTDLHIQ
jgi:DNA modification methylase